MSRYSEAVEQGYDGRSPFDERLRQAWLKAHGLPDSEAEPGEGHTATNCPVCGGDCELEELDESVCPDCGYEYDEDGECLCSFDPEPGEDTPEVAADE